MFEAGVGRAVFRAVTLLLPRVSTLADASAALAGSAPVDGAQLSRMLASLLAFALAALALGVWRFEQKDF
jgi:Cu-processing system permease protein